MIVAKRRAAVLHGEIVQVESAWRDALASAGIARASGWPDLTGTRLMSASSTSRCYRLTLDSGSTVYFKREVFPLKRRLRYWLRPAKTTVEVFAYERLSTLNIPTLTTLAYGERRRFGMLSAAFIVTEEVPETMDLQRFALSLWCTMEPVIRRAVYQQITSSLLRQLRKAHDAGFFHHDLKWRNILVRDTGRGYDTVWIDAPRASLRRLRRRRGVVVDLSCLARLAVSLTSKYDRMRFLCQYLGPDRQPRAASRLYRAIYRHLQRRPPRPLPTGPALEGSESV